MDDVLDIVARTREASDPAVHMIHVHLIDAIQDIFGRVPSHRRVLAAQHFEPIHLTPLTILWTLPSKPYPLTAPGLDFSGLRAPLPGENKDPGLRNLAAGARLTTPDARVNRKCPRRGRGRGERDREGTARERTVEDRRSAQVDGEGDRHGGRGAGGGGGGDDVPADGDAGSEIVSRVVRDLDDGGEAALDPGLEDHGGAAKAAGAGAPAAVSRRAWRGGRASTGGAVRGALAGLAAEVGAADLQGGGGPEGDGARDAGAARDAGGGQRDHLSRGGVGARPRVVQDDGRELREARGGGGRAAETGARRCSPEGGWRRDGRPPQYLRRRSNRSPIVPRTVLSIRTEENSEVLSWS